MDTLTYSIILGIVFFTGVFAFTYFETPRKTLNRGMRRLRNLKITDLKPNKTLTIPGQNKKLDTIRESKNDGGDLRIYVHEY